MVQIWPVCTRSSVRQVPLPLRPDSAFGVSYPVPHIPRQSPAVTMDILADATITSSLSQTEVVAMEDAGTPPT
jgi:hypothetical protein